MAQQSHEPLYRHQHHLERVSVIWGQRPSPGLILFDRRAPSEALC